MNYGGRILRMTHSIIYYTFIIRWSNPNILLECNFRNKIHIDTKSGIYSAQYWIYKNSVVTSMANNLPWGWTKCPGKTFVFAHVFVPRARSCLVQTFSAIWRRFATTTTVLCNILYIRIMFLLKAKLWRVAYDMMCHATTNLEFYLV